MKRLPFILHPPIILIGAICCTLGWIFGVLSDALHRVDDYCYWLLTGKDQ